MSDVATDLRRAADSAEFVCERLRRAAEHTEHGREPTAESGTYELLGLAMSGPTATWHRVAEVDRAVRLLLGDRVPFNPN